MAEQLAIDWAGGTALVAGVDEAGRGPLAGPVVAAAVILRDGDTPSGLADSKCLSERQRRRLAQAIRTSARAFAIALAQPDEIDELNILQASMLAMSRAVAKLRVRPTHVRVDGNRVPRLNDADAAVTVEAVVRGDALVPSISAASILAKVSRDALMLRWHRRFPGYGFDRHKGYPTPQHLAALRKLGPCPIHRQSFAPVRAALADG